MSSKQFTAQTFAWLRLLKSDRDLTALAVGVELTEYFNEKEGGVAYPGSDRMAESLGLSQSTVIRALHRMADRGRIRAEWGQPGRGHSNRIWMIVKHAPEHVSGGRKHAPESNKTCAGAYEPLRNQEESERAFLTESPSLTGRESAPSARENHPFATGAPPPDGGTPPPASPPAPPQQEPEGQEAREAPRGAVAGSETAARASLRVRGEPTASHIEAAFQDLRALWRRGHARDDRPDVIAMQRAAFARAVAKGVHTADILAGARAWIAAADAPRYLPELIGWLDGESWRKPPPTKSLHREAVSRGNGRGRYNDGLPRTNGNKVDLPKLSLLRAGYIEDENGKLYHPDGDAGSCLRWSL